jgi:hypothetical protein
LYFIMTCQVFIRRRPWCSGPSSNRHLSMMVMITAMAVVAPPVIIVDDDDDGE